MNLRFEVNQAEALRRGTDCRNSVCTVEVDPAQLPEDARNALADRMIGIDVCELLLKSDGTTEPGQTSDNNHQHWRPLRVTANLPTLEALLAAVRADAERIAAEKQKREAKQS